MSTFSLILTIGRELWPFLKEALFEGQTFRAWLKTNWLTFAWLVNTLVMTMMIAHLSDLVMHAHQNELRAEQRLRSIELPIAHFLGQYKQLKDENAQLTLTISQMSEKVGLYEQWMSDCGVKYKENGQCKVEPKPVTPRRRHRPTAPKPKVQDVQEDKPGFLERLRNLLSRDKTDKE